MLKTISMIGAAAAMVAGPALAQTQPVRVDQVRGEVLVSKGAGFVRATNATLVRPGDRVLARSGAARLVYANGCSVQMASGTLATVAATSPCGAKSGTLVKDRDFSRDQGGEDAGFFSAGYVLPAIAGIAVIGIAAYVASDTNSSSP